MSSAAEWDRVPLKQVAIVIPGQSPPSVDVVDLAGNVPPFLQGNAEFTSVSPVAIHACSSAAKRSLPGDILMSIRAPVGALNISDQSYGIGRGLCAIRATSIHPRFLWWAINNSVEDLDSRSTGSTYLAVTADDVKTTRIPAPPLATQKRIADFLDTETARIDALITKKRRMIELLEERSESSPNEAIGSLGKQDDEAIIPTIASIPAHWDLPRNKTFLREVTRPSKTGQEEMLSVSHLTGVTPRSQKTVYMFEAASNVGYKLVRPGDLVINTMWAWMGAAGVSEHHGIVSPAYGVYELNQDLVEPKWIDMLVRTPAYITEMTRFSRGVTSSRLRLYPDEFLRLRSPIPPLAEQQSVARKFHEDNVIRQHRTAALTTQLTLLAERRQALITAAVTGELDIPEVAA